MTTGTVSKLVIASIVVACMLATLTLGNEEEEKGDDCTRITDEFIALTSKCKLEHLAEKNCTDDDVVDGIRCAWDYFSEIEPIAGMVAICRDRYPKEEGKPLCDLKIIVCTYEAFAQKCPTLVKIGQTTAKPNE